MPWPTAAAVRLSCTEKSHIEVDRRAVGIARMQDQRDAHRFPRPAGEMWARGGGRRRQLLALHVRKVDAGALEEVSFFEDSGCSPAALRSLPGVRSERLAVESLQSVDDAHLKVREVFENLHFRLIAR